MDTSKQSQGEFLAVSEESICGLDIGGANIKFATPCGQTYHCPFPMWQTADRLAAELRRGLQELRPKGNFRNLAVTMTGELADCFANRRSGVQHILQHVEQAALGSRVFVYAVGGKWLSMEQAIGDPWNVAASNWHAMTCWATQLLNSRHRGQDCMNVTASEEESAEHSPTGDELQAGLVIDVGSTTVDIIPFCGCNVWTPARTDRDRLQSRQLIYTGLERTPVSAILREVELDGQRCPLMAERFADSGDAYRALGEIAEDSDNCDTADGRSRTRVNSAARLARMVGEDLETLGSKQVRCLALQIVEAQLQQILEGVHSNLNGMANSLGLGDCQNKPMTIVLCGHGKPILDRIRKRLSDSQLRITDLQNWVGESVSRCAPAMSVASLLSSHLLAESQVH